MSVCDSCGKDFSHNRAGQKYCSIRCRQNARNIRRRESGENLRWYEAQLTKIGANRKSTIIQTRAEENKSEIRRRYALMAKYGITAEQWEEVFNSQGRKCAICEVNDAVWNTDHCHDTGRVRGILCPNCNKALGYLKDNLDLVMSAAAYLMQSENLLSLGLGGEHE